VDVIETTAVGNLDSLISSARFKFIERATHFDCIIFGAPASKNGLTTCLSLHLYIFYGSGGRMSS